MKKLYKAALLAALGLTSVTAAQASTTDVLLGFSDAAGPSAAQNDYVIDLGAASQFTTSASLNLSSSVNWTTFGTAFSADASALNNVTAAALQSTGTDPATVFLSGSVLGTNPSRSVFNGLNNQIQNGLLAFGITPISSGQWSSVMLANIQTYGESPSVQASSGLITETLWESTQTFSGANGTAWVDVGTFNINLNTDSLSFNGAAVPAPEPSTCALFGGAGIMVLFFRNKFRRIQA